MFDTFYDQNDLIGIQPEPCLTPFFTGNLLHEIFNYDLPQADAILAAAEQAGLNYSLWYYYDRIQSHYYNFNLFPCMILTSDAAILCSSDYQNGIFIKSPDVVQLLWNQFISYKEQCSLFFLPKITGQLLTACLIPSMTRMI